MTHINILVTLFMAVATLGCGNPTSSPPTIATAPADESEPANPSQPEIAAPVDAVKESFTDEKLQLTFPSTLGHLSFAGYDEFEEPGMGYNIRYNTTDNMKVDIYVYDKGRLSIPDGDTDPAVAKELAGSDSTIRFYEQQGTYLAVKELGRGVYPEKSEPGDVTFLFSRYQYHQAARKGVTFTGERISETFIRGFRDHFVKVRVSYPEASAERSVVDREILMQQLSQTMKTQAAERAA
ncbi:MAG TPA: hypothetical protein VGM98_18790, partial [Schlesneria sp.]